MNRILFPLALLLCSQVNAETIYRCDQQGVPTFTDQPCGPDAQRVSLEVSPPGEPAQDWGSYHSELAHRLNDRRTARMMTTLEGRKRQARRQRDEAIQALSGKLANAQRPGERLAIQAEIQSQREAYRDRATLIDEAKDKVLAQ